MCIYKSYNLLPTIFIYSLFIINLLSSCSFSLFGGDYTEYTIRRGDTLSSIAVKFNTNVQNIIRLNNLKNANKIILGQTIKVPLSDYKIQTQSTNSKSTSLRASVKSLGVSPLHWSHPVRNGFVVSTFGYRSKGFHYGIDISSKFSEPIYSVLDGTVIYSGNALSGYGNLIIIAHKDKISTIYAHNYKNLVKKGDRVKKNQKIALMGSTGKSTGVHLHFETRLRDSSNKYVAVDPMPLLFYSYKQNPRYSGNNRLDSILK